LGYSKAAVENHERAISRLEQFLLENRGFEYSEVLMQTYLVGISKEYAKSSLENIRRILLRFNAFVRGEGFVFTQKRMSRECPAQFEKTLESFLENLRFRGLKERTVDGYHYNILKVLRIFDGLGIKKVTDIKPKDIYSAFEKTSDKMSFSHRMGGFFRYLYEEKITESDYTTFIPTVRKPRPNPSIYTKSETEALLKNIDLSTKHGNRSYAMILLALRLGMRSGDIANLKIADIDFENKEIRFCQEKTQVVQRLELLPEVEVALLSCISTARPVSNFPNVFLSVVAPIKPITSSAIKSSVAYHLEKSGVEIGERSRGAHSLRSTLASELVAEKVPYDVIRKILGHTDPTAIKHYVKFDIEALRSCALESPPITGKLAIYMKVRLGGLAQ